MGKKRKYFKKQVCLFSIVLLSVSMITGCEKKDTTSPDNVLGFAAATSDSKVSLAWTNPQTDDFDGVIILRSGDSYPSSHNDGTLVYQDNGQSFEDIEVSNGSTYYYTAFAYDKARNHASGVNAIATPIGLTGEYDVLGDLDRVEQLLLDADDDQLSEDERQALLDKLHQARNAYQQDDICGASLALIEFIALTQGFRQEANQGLLDELYNRGRMARYGMVSSLRDEVQCPNDGRVGAEAKAILNSDASDNKQLKAAIRFGEPRLMTLDVDEGDFDEVVTRVQVPGCATVSGSPGLPAVPVLRQIIAVPGGAEISIDLETTVAETIKLNLIPNQPQPLDGPVDPGLFADKPFVRNDETYNTDAPYPESPATMTEMGQYRDLRMVMVEIAAGQYNPQSDELTLFEAVDVDVSFGSDSAGAFVTEASASPFESMPEGYVGPAFNGEDVFEFVEPREDLATIAGEELLIVTHPAFLEPSNRLAEWKRLKGIVTSVVVVHDDENPSLPYTKEEIDGFIEDRYDQAFIRMSYILLMGDSEFIPPFYVMANPDPYVPERERIATDLPYGVYSPTADADMLPDFAVGRIPVERVEDAIIIVDKIIDYESVPPARATFYTHAAIASQFECCRGDAAADPGMTMRTFTQSSEFARNVMLRNGYFVDRIYEMTGEGTPARYKDGTMLPHDLGPGSGFEWNGNASDIANAFNDGRFLFIHRDHGGKYSWEHPYFDVSNIEEDLSNGSLLPVVFSVNCATGWYDDNSDGPVFIEALLRHPTGGAVGVLGDTRNSPTYANTALVKGFIDAVWPEALPDFGSDTSKRRLGDILNHGKLYMMTQVGVSGANVYAADAEDDMHLWHVFGDPTLEIWTENPDASVLSTSASAMMGASSLDFVYGVEGATVTAHQGSLSAGPLTIGRGEVVDGVAEIPFINDPDEDEEIGFSVTFPDSVAELIVLSLKPPENVGNLQAAVDETQIELTWTNPPDDDFEGVKIQRMTEGFPAAPDMGTAVYDGDGESFVDIGLIYGVTYYYTAFSYDADLNYASGAPVSARPNYGTPQADVTNLEGRAVFGHHILTWTNPENEEFLGVRILRNRHSYPTSEEHSAPIYEGPLETYSDDYPCPTRRTYLYSVYAYDDLANFSSGREVAIHCFSAEPPGNVTGFAAEAGDAEVFLMWTNPADETFDRVMIIRTTDGASTVPDDFIEFSDMPDEPDGGAPPLGIEVYDGPDQSFTDTGLLNDVTYYYTAFTLDADDNWASGVGVSATPVIDIVAPASVGGMSAVAGDTQVALSWTNPSDFDFAGVRVMRQTGAYPASPTAGTLVYNGIGESTTDTGLTNGVAYYYAAFAYDEVPIYASSDQATATPADVYAPANVVELGCSVDGQSITLSWTNPGDSDYAGVTIRRSGTAYPTSPEDGVPVYDGLETQYVDLQVGVGLTYFYTAFSYDEIPNYSPGAQTVCTVE